MLGLGLRLGLGLVETKLDMRPGARLRFTQGKARQDTHEETIQETRYMTRPPPPPGQKHDK